MHAASPIRLVSHPLIAEHGDLKAYHPMTAGLFFAPGVSGNGHAGQAPAAVTAEDRTVLWDGLLRVLPGITGRLIRIAGEGLE